MFVLVALVLGVIGAVCAGSWDNDVSHAGAAAQHHCVLHCTCHAPALTPASVSLVGLSPLQFVLPDLDLFRPRLLAADIFNPPKA